MVSNKSAEFVDAWSLTSITTPSGAVLDIAYESDSYENVELSKQASFRVKEVIDLQDGNKLEIVLHEEVTDLSGILNDKFIDISLVGSYDNQEFNAIVVCETDCWERPPTLLTKLIEGESLFVNSVDPVENSIVIDDDNFYYSLKHEAKTLYQRGLGFGGNSQGVNCNNIQWECSYTFSGQLAWPKYIPAGVISVIETEKAGGGVRVASIILQDESNNEIRRTNYEYQNGTTSYEPFKLLPPIIDPNYPAESFEGTKKKFKKALLKKHYDVLGVAREIPGPGVMYEKVIVSEKSSDCPSETNCFPEASIYEFEVFHKNMIGFNYGTVATYESHRNKYEDIKIRKMRLKDYSNRVGALKSITLYDRVSENILSKTENHYLHDGLIDVFADNETAYDPLLKEKFFNQGVVEETFSNARTVKYKFGDNFPYFENEYKSGELFEEKFYLLGIISKKEKYPSILTGQTNTNYKTGMVNKSENLAFDFYSGAVTKTLSYDSYGNYYVNETVPAYTEYPAMGSKAFSPDNKNMLTQEAASYSYKVASGNYDSELGLLGASVQTWSNDVDVLHEGKQADVWRKHAAYFWDGAQTKNDDGTYKMGEFDSNGFDFISPGTNPLWEKSGELTLYDVFSHGLEATDINGDYGATRMDPNQYRVIANASNARYNEMAYSGAEYYSASQLTEGGVDIGTGEISIARSHTGKVSLKVPSGNEGFICQLDNTVADLNQKFKAYVWLYVPGDGETAEEIDGAQLYYTVNGVTTEVHPTLYKSKSKNWYRLEIVADPQGAGTIEFGCRNETARPVYFDDFKVVPFDGAMTAYVYDPDTGELNYILDNNNFYTRFEYDDMGRLTRTTRESLNFDFGDGKDSYKADQIVGETIYNYGLQSHN